MRRSPAGKQEVLNVAFAGEVAIYLPLKGVHAQAFDAPMMEVEDHLWIQLAMESKKIQARLTLMLMLFSELWEKPKVSVVVGDSGTRRRMLLFLPGMYTK